MSIKQFIVDLLKEKVSLDQNMINLYAYTALSKEGQINFSLTQRRVQFALYRLIDNGKIIYDRVNGRYHLNQQPPTNEVLIHEED